MSLKNLNIVIDGNIGSGKSTVLSNLRDKNGFKVTLEDITSWKPYLKQFYDDMNKFSLSFQMKVLLHHLKNYQETLSSKSPNILERSPLSCIHIFGQSLRNSHFISDLDISLMKEYNKNFGWFPEFLIYIKTDPEVCFKRILERARPGEHLPLEYLKDIDTLYNNLYLDKENLQNLGINTHIIVVDGNKNQDEVHREVLTHIINLLDQPVTI